MAKGDASFADIRSSPSWGIRDELAGRPFEDHWRRFQDMAASQGEPVVVWTPDDARLTGANLARLAQVAGTPQGAAGALHRWSVDDRERFWGIVIDQLGIPFHEQPDAVLGNHDAEDPDWLPGARLNIAKACFQADPDAPAVISCGEADEQVTVSYGELEALADRFAHGLVAAGLVRGDAVALYLPMNVECVAAYLGTVKAGCTVVSIPDSFAPAEVATRLRLGGAKAIVTVASFLRAGREVPMYPKAAEAADQMGPEARPRCIVLGAARLAEGDVPWDDFLGPAEPFEAVPCDPQDVTNILFSSGTTGDPKAIPWTHLTPIKSAMDGHYHQDIHPGDVVCWPTNIGWMMGPWLIYAALVNGATIALWQGVPTSAGFLEFVRQAKVGVLGLVPAIARAWREQLLAGPGDLPDVKTWSSTGEASNAHDYLYLMSLADYNAPVIEYCGGTEIGGGHLTGTVWQPCSPATFTSPALGLDIVVREEHGGWAEVGGSGEIFLVPPSIGLSQRLLNKDHHEEYYAGTPRGPDGELLRRHGDEVQVLPGGYWAAQGRADDTMNLGGIKVSSIELERVMNEHPDVVETAAVAVLPEGGGADRLVVFAVVRPGAEIGPLQAGLQERIKRDLNPLFRIHAVVAVEALPRTASNKVMRRELRARYSG